MTQPVPGGAGIQTTNGHEFSRIEIGTANPANPANPANLFFDEEGRKFRKAMDLNPFPTSCLPYSTFFIRVNSCPFVVHF